MKQGITAHMIVKNEDQWIWYAIHSVLPYVEQILISDTGSSDQTIEIIKSIKSPKIIFTKQEVSTREQIAEVRQSQIDQTQTNWIWIVDGDEIYPENLLEEIVLRTSQKKYLCIVVRRHDLLGDIYHKQDERIGAYRMFGQDGHLLIRLLNLGKLKELTVSGSYPLESYFSGDKCVNDLPRKDVYITKHALYHAMYLRRSSLGSNLPMFNRNKFKIERGLPVLSPYPRVFDMPHPFKDIYPLKKRSMAFEVIASLVTPIKKLKRKLV